MPVEKALPLAVGFGALVGGTVYISLLSDWYPALGIAAIYAGASYFYLSADVSLLGTDINFSNRTDKLGYAVGLFGLSVSPLAFGEYAGLRDSTVTVMIVGLIGTIAFLLWSTTAALQESPSSR
jgi:hypothetical protein